MFGMGMPEMILILAIALIVLGPKKLPDLAKSLGRAMREFKKATSEIKESIEVDNDFKDIKKPFEDLSADVKSSFDVSVASTESTQTPPSDESSGDAKQDEPAPASDTKTDTKTETKTETKMETETKTETKTETETEMETEPDTKDDSHGTSKDG